MSFLSPPIHDDRRPDGPSLAPCAEFAEVTPRAPKSTPVHLGYTTCCRAAEALCEVGLKQDEVKAEKCIQLRRNKRSKNSRSTYGTLESNYPRVFPPGQEGGEWKRCGHANCRAREHGAISIKRMCNFLLHSRRCYGTLCYKGLSRSKIPT
jgi:hypothetical protein